MLAPSLGRTLAGPACSRSKWLPAICGRAAALASVVVFETVARPPSPNHNVRLEPGRTTPDARIESL